MQNAYSTTEKEEAFHKANGKQHTIPTNIVRENRHHVTPSGMAQPLLPSHSQPTILPYYRFLNM